VILFPAASEVALCPLDNGCLILLPLSSSNHTFIRPDMFEIMIQDFREIFEERMRVIKFLTQKGNGRK
jgi:hypothetical protein